jgi:hypothetical protein
MNRLCALLLLACSIASVAAADAPPRSEFTRGTPTLRLVERSDSYTKGSFARWTGKLVLAGKVVVEFDRPPPGGEPTDDVGVIFFEPSADSLRLLPAAVGSYYPLKPSVLWLEASPPEVLTPLIGAASVEQLLRSKPPRYEVPATLRLRELFTSVECDHRAYSIRYDQLRLLGADLIAMGEAKNIGC